MKTQLLSTLVLLVSISSFGFSPQRDAMKLVRKAQQTKAKSTPPTPSTCADLAGTWEAQCTKEDGTLEYSKIKVIQSQCLSLKIKTLAPYPEDSTDMNMDMTGMGVTSISSSSAFASYTASVAGHWNTDNTIAQIEVVAIVNSPFLTAPKTMKASFQVLREGDNLIQFGKGEGFDVGGGERYCKYTKAN